MSQDNPFEQQSNPQTGGQPFAATPQGQAGTPTGTWQNNQPQYPAQNAYNYGQPPIAPQQTNTMAIVSLILSMVGFITFISAPAGAIVGHIALRQLKENPNQNGRGMALAGVIIGWILTALGILTIIGFVIFISMFLPQLVNSGALEELQRSATEDAAAWAGTLPQLLA